MSVWPEWRSQPRVLQREEVRGKMRDQEQRLKGV